MAKRACVAVVTCLIIGIAMNIAVAMLCSLAAQQVPGQVSGSVGSSPTTEEYFEIHRRVEDVWLWARMERPGYKEYIFLTQSDDHKQNAIMVEIEAGWPWKSLRRFDRTEKTNVALTRLWLSYHNQPRVASADAEGFLIPTTPIWSGFVLNSLLYAAALWVVFVAIPSSRQFIRVRRDLCPRCAYPIGASDRCTECGERVPVAACNPRSLTGGLNGSEPTHCITPLESGHGSPADS